MGHVSHPLPAFVVIEVFSPTAQNFGDFWPEPRKNWLRILNDFRDLPLVFTLFAAN
jgi:hypothetical protein